MLKLHQFHGGLHLDGHKTESLGRGLQQATLTERLFLPLKQHIGEYNKPLVEPGDRVLRGQVIAANPTLICASVHAPTSGVVSAIGDYQVAHPSGQSDPIEGMPLNVITAPPTSIPVPTTVQTFPLRSIFRACSCANSNWSLFIPEYGLYR